MLANVWNIFFESELFLLEKWGFCKNSWTARCVSLGNLNGFILREDASGFIDNSDDFKKGQ